jgi:hypothetical protein
MIRRIHLFIGFGVFLLLLSCASQKMVAKAPPPKFNGIVLAKDVDTSGTVGVPVEPTSNFFNNDEQVVAFLSLDDVTGSHTLRWEWIAPDGGIYLVSNDYSLVSKQREIRAQGDCLAPTFHKLRACCRHTWRMEGCSLCR